jgi:class 3 adenylate cyclase/tetratricopeptide (TPR) repeat protein
MSNSEWLGPQREGPQRESGSIQALHAQAKRLAAYLPITLVRQILEGELPPPGTAVWLNAATLFSDISGFTGMAESLAPAGPRGAEELNRALLMTFTGLINAIHDAGGAVVHFHGDAMLVYFPDNDGRAAARALACATFMQRLMLTSLSQFSTQLLTSEPATFSLTIKIGVGYGRCLQTTIGHPQESLEFVLGGTAVDEAATAQQQAAAGEVIASQSVLAQAGLPTAAPFHTVDQISPVPHAREELHWHAYPAHALHRLLHTAPAFIPAPLVERLQHQTTRFIAEHRTITSLFVQFEGITFDAPDAGAKLQTYYEWARQVVARFGPRNGRVNRLLTGDKGSQLHILFGAPIAPDAPEQAIRCALALQREKPAFITHQQIGLAVGPVFATAVGSQNRREYTAVGRIVNLSAHLTLHCPPDQILVDDATANRVWEQFQFTPHTAANLKGQTEPMATYLAVQEQVNPTPFATRFARWQKTPPGREAETAQLRQRINTALHGHGGLLALSGPFGGGIRPLLADAARRWLDAGGRGFSSICQPHLADAPFAAWQTIWRDFLNLTPTMSPDEQAAHARHEIRNWLPGWADEVALWLSVLGLPVSARESSDESAVAPNVRQLWLFTLIQRCLAQAARQQPLLILMEDVQWADEASRELVAAVAAHAADLPLLMVVTFRPTPPFHFPALHQPATTHIILADWSAEQARAVARRRLGTGELPPLLEQRLGLKDANGRDTDQVNPLFLEESLKLMLAADVLQFPGTGHSRLQIDEARLSALPIPTTIAALLQTRLDALSAGAYSLLQMASVIGREFALNLLMAVMPGLTAETALPLLAELAAADLVQTVTGAPQPVFMFQHILVQEVVYRSLPYARRQAVHLDIADWLVAQTSPAAPALYPLLAHHYGQAGAHEAGCQYALAAAREATALYANRAAAGYFQQAFNHLQAMGIAERVETAVAILTSQAEAYLRLGELEAAAKAVAAALDLGDGAEDRQATPTLLNVLAEIGLAQARYPEAAAVTRQVITRSGTMPPILAARAHQLAGQAATALRQWSLAEMELNTARTILKSNQLTRPLPELLAAFGELRCQQGAWPHAADLCLHAVDLAQQTGLPIPTAAALLSLAQVQLAQGRAREAAQTATEGVELARTTSPRLLAHLLIGRVDAWLYDGRFPEALADLQLAADVLAVMDDGLARLRLGLRWAVYCAGQADWEGSLGQLDRARGQLAVLHKTGGTAVLESVQLRLGLAQIALHTKQWEQAISLLAAAETEATTHQLVWLRPALAYWQGMVQMALGQAELAMHAFREGVTATPAGGCPDELPLLLLRLGQLTPPAHPRHWEYLEGCVTAVYDRARHTDKQFCLQEAGLLLLHAPDARLRRMGAACLAAI